MDTDFQDYNNFKTQILLPSKNDETTADIHTANNISVRPYCY